MKRNLISIVILALLAINIVFSAITMFSVASTNKKTAALVTDIASAIQIDLKGTEVSGNKNVPMENVVTYDIAEMTIALKRGVDEEGNVDTKDNFAMVTVTLSMDSKHKDYKTYGDLSTRESLIKGEINDVISEYTIDEVRGNNHALEEEILQRIQTMFNSDFVYDIIVTALVS